MFYYMCGSTPQRLGVGHAYTLGAKFEVFASAMDSCFFCALCDKHYDFRSRFDQHLASSGHRMLEEIQKLNPPSTFVANDAFPDKTGSEDAQGSGTHQLSENDVRSFLRVYMSLGL